MKRRIDRAVEELLQTTVGQLFADATSAAGKGILADYLSDNGGAEREIQTLRILTLQCSAPGSEIPVDEERLKGFKRGQRVQFLAFLIKRTARQSIQGVIAPGGSYREIRFITIDGIKIYWTASASAKAAACCLASPEGFAPVFLIATIASVNLFSGWVQVGRCDVCRLDNVIGK